MKAALREAVLGVGIAAVVTVLVLAYGYAGTHRDGLFYHLLAMATVFGATLGFGLLLLTTVDRQSTRGRKPADLTVTITADVEPFRQAMRETAAATRRLERKIGGDR